MLVVLGSRRLLWLGLGGVAVGNLCTIEVKERILISAIEIPGEGEYG